LGFRRWELQPRYTAATGSNQKDRNSSETRRQRWADSGRLSAWSKREGTLSQSAGLSTATSARFGKEASCRDSRRYV
ncbi:hypothetical protein, partial [Acinetobacter sp. LH3_13]|uniref:hypothetical protein n=1 Tax=Acinetobacter sp. LH3_13 TaxID=3434463 RepID=UPI003EBD2D7D